MVQVPFRKKSGKAQKFLSLFDAQFLKGLNRRPFLFLSRYFDRLWKETRLYALKGRNLARGRKQMFFAATICVRILAHFACFPINFKGDKKSTSWSFFLFLFYFFTIVNWFKLWLEVNLSTPPPTINEPAVPVKRRCWCFWLRGTAMFCPGHRCWESCLLAPRWFPSESLAAPMFHVANGN